MAGQSTNSLPQKTTLSHLLGEVEGTTARQSVADLALQLSARPELIALNDGLEARVSTAEEDIGTLQDATAYASILKATWVDLAALSGTADGQRAEVAESDTDTHAAASPTGYDGATVDNAGAYSWNGEWSRWERISDTGAAMQQAQIALKADAADIPDFAEAGTAEATPKAPAGQAYLNDTWINPRLGQSIRDIYRRPNRNRAWADRIMFRDMILRAQAQARIPYSGKVIYCDPTAAGAGDGTSWADAYTTVLPAFEEAVAGDVIRLNSTDDDPFPAQSISFTASRKNRVHIQCDRGPDRMAVFDNRLFGTWTDEGGGVFSMAATYYGAAAYDFKQDDEAGTNTGCNWTRPKYAEVRKRYKRTVEQVAAWYGVLRETTSATTTPAEGECSYSGGRYYINPPGSPVLADVNALACVPRYTHVLSVKHLENCYWSGKTKLIFAPHKGGGAGYGASLNGEWSTIADAETVCTGYHAIGWAGSSGAGNKIVNCTANGTCSNSVAGTSNAYVFFSPDANVEQSECQGVGNFSVHYPALSATGVPHLYYSNYAPNHGLSHSSGGNLYGGVRWSNSAQVDFCHQIKRNSGTSFTVAGAFVNGSDTGTVSHVDDPNEWSLVAEDCDVLGAAAKPSHSVDHYDCHVDRDNLGDGDPLNGFVITTTAGGASSKQYRMRGGRLATGAHGGGAYIGPTAPGDRMHIENLELILEDAKFHSNSGYDAADPFLRMGGCVVKSKVKNTGLLAQSASAFAEGPGINFRSLGGNVFGEMGAIQVRAGHPSVAGYTRDNQTWIDAVNPAITDVIDAELYQFTEGPELLANGDFASGDLTGWINDGNWFWTDVTGDNSAENTGGVTSKLYQNFDCDEGDLLLVKFGVVGRSSASILSTRIKAADNSGFVEGFDTLTSNQTEVRSYEYRLRAAQGWGCIYFEKPASPSGLSRIANVSVKKLTILR